jgi:hypothetical protein
MVLCSDWPGNLHPFVMDVRCNFQPEPWLCFICYYNRGIILATRAYRDQEQGGYITYGRALAVGTLTVLFAGVITSVFTYLLVYRY